MADRIAMDDAESIIREYYNDIYKYCYWHTKSSADAQDITQETFLRFVKSLASYVDMGKPKALLYTIARNLCVNCQRKPACVPLDNVASACVLTHETDAVIDKLWLEAAVSALPPLEQEVLQLKYGQDLKVGDIATILKVSRFTVMYRIRCAMGRLKKMKLGDDED